MNPYDEYIINADDFSVGNLDPRHHHTITDADYKKRIKDEGKNGDCFEKNYKAFWDIYRRTKNKNLKFVIAQFEYKRTGNQVIHAFVLDGDDMIDKSQGKDIRISLDLYLTHMADIKMSKIWDANTIPRWEGIINRYESYQCLENANVRWDIGFKRQIGSWDLAKLEVL